MTPDKTGPEALVRTYKEIKADYAYDPDIMCQDDERARAVKWIIDNRLSQVDKTIFLLYTDCQSYRRLGQRMLLSHVTAGREIQRIKAIIFQELRKLTETWRDVRGYEGLYQISNHGEVRSLYTGRILTPDKRDGTVRLTKDKVRRSFKIEKLTRP